MSAPLTDFSMSSISASGLVDGLGRRALAFDRETGVMLERVILRPELAAFEAAIRERVDLLAAIDDERFARPGAVQRDPETGELSVVSEFVAGSRLSDIIETAEEAGLIPGVDVALGFLLEALPAISTFHNVTGFAHGLIEPSRMVITPATGQIVFLDPSFGSVIERLGLARTRLWSELGIAAPASAGPVRLDIPEDISQLALTALMLVIGRRLRDDEYPDGVQAVVAEVAEVAQIRGSHLFATSLQRLLHRALRLSGNKPYESADDLANEIRLLLRREIGAEVCRQALVDFSHQMDAAATAEEHGNGFEPATSEREYAVDEDVLQSVDSFEVLDEDGDAQSDTFESEEETDDEYAEVPLDTDSFGEPAAVRAAAPEDSTPEPFEDRRFEPTPFEDFSSTEEFTASEESATTPFEDSVPDEPVAEDATAGQDEADSGFETASADVADVAAPADEIPRGNARRRKRQNKSARARKDKLRSTARPPAPAPPPSPPPKPAEPRPAGQSGWLVSPDKAAAFAPPVPEQAPASPPVAARPMPSPPIVAPHPPAPIPMPVAPIPQPAARPVIPMPSYAPVQTTVHAPAAPPPQPAPITVRQPAPANPGPVRLKSEPPKGYAPRASEPIAAPPYVHRAPLEPEETESKFPWKLAAAAIVFVVIAVVVGRHYLPTSTETKPPAADAQTAAPLVPPPMPAPKVETGDLTIETQPSGARVLLDGKPVGLSPLKLAGVPVGRHVLTFISSSGEVNRTVRVATGKTLEVDVSIFSGWLAVFAPVVLDISLNGKSLGSTEQSRLMIPPGRHELTLSNKEFGYKSIQEVTVEPGEVRSLTVEPRGDANFNAIPWAEVWMDGQKLGDTPLANMRVPLGTREFVFKHPQYGERRITAIIRADQPTPVSVDFTKSQ